MWNPTFTGSRPPPPDPRSDLSPDRMTARRGGSAHARPFFTFALTCPTPSVRLQVRSVIATKVRVTRGGTKPGGSTGWSALDGESIDGDRPVRYLRVGPGGPSIVAN